MKFIKWTASGLGIIIAVAHIGILGHLIKKEPVKINYPPSGDYTTYSVKVNADGSYTIDYKSHDPKVLTSDNYTDSSRGVFGIGGRSTTTRSTQFVPGTKSDNQAGVDGEGKGIVKSEECIKAEGGGESNGALIGSSLAASAAPSLTTVPYVGWLAAGWLVLFGQEAGSQIGGEIATSVKGC